MNCPECGDFLGRKTNCECGYSKIKKGNDGESHDLRCRWVNKSSHKRCKLIGTNTQSGKEWYCSWHNISLGDPEWAEDYNQFYGWHNNIILEYPKSEWLATEMAWKMVSGG